MPEATNLISQAESLSTGDLGELGLYEPGLGEDPTGELDRGALIKRLSMTGLVLAIPITLIVVTHAEVLTFSFVLFLMIQGPRDRHYYQPRLKLDPQYNAALLIEKRRTGLSISEIPRPPCGNTSPRTASELFSSGPLARAPFFTRPGIRG